MLKLDLGAGNVSPEGFTPLGNVNGSMIYPLHHADNSVDVIRASHVLEHFARSEIDAVLAEWVRVLKPGGELRIAVPDFGKIAEGYVSGIRQDTIGYVMGGQIDSADFHKTIFDEDSLKEALAAAGLILLTPWKSEILGDCAAHPISLNVAGRKPARSRPSVRAVMTSPRLGFNDMWNSAIASLPRLGIEMTNVGGAFWDQCLTLAFERVLSEDEPDYLLSIDYDSVFHAGHVSKLIQLAMLRPDVDAIAPVQASRHGSNPLFGLAKDTEVFSRGEREVVVSRDDFEVDLVSVRQAHFGLTLIKVEALKRLPKPWFVGSPNSEGRWTDGKVDPDIHFWRSWEKAGMSLCLAPRVVIGHIEVMVRWPNEESMAPIWQPAKDWEATKRPPIGAWSGGAQ